MPAQNKGIQLRLRIPPPGMNAADVMTEFGCSKADAEDALTWSSDLATSMFVDHDVPEITGEYLGAGISAVPKGDGLFVTGLPERKTWTTNQRTAWAVYGTMIHERIKEYASRYWMSKALAESGRF